MQHLEEGTIHAWLDGELGAAEAASLEAHVATCVDCAALVAEARGLAAASSRILGALDDVPSGVRPEAKPPVALRSEVVVTTPSPTIDLAAHREARATPRKTRRIVNPRYATAAALVVMAVGTWTIMQRTPGERSIVAPVPIVARDTRAEAAAPTDSLRNFAAPSAAPAPAADQASIPQEMLKKERAANGPTVGARPTSPSAGGAVASLERAEADASAAGKASAANEPRARQILADAAELERRRERVDTVREATPPASAPKRFAAAVDSLTANEASRVRGEAKAQAAVPAPTVAALSSRVQTAPAALDKRDTSRSLCFAIDRTPRAVELDVPARVELRDEDGPQVDGATWKLVQVEGPVQPAEAWFWRRTTEGGVSLAQFRGTPLALLHQVDVVGALTAPGQVRGARVACVVR